LEWSMGQWRDWERILKFLDSNESETTTYQNLGDTEKSVLKEKFIAMSTYIRN
jgi:hypothetical protein